MNQGQSLLQNSIDVEKWSAAQWTGTAFLFDPTGINPPCLGLVFQNIQTGRDIFQAWVARFGPEDRFEELRVAIIEGVIRGHDPGYCLHLAGRVCRMTPESGSSHLAQFKADLQEHRRYLLVAVSADIEPQFDCAIEKSQIHFRRVSQLTRHDIDAVVLPPDYFDR